MSEQLAGLRFLCLLFYTKLKQGRACISKEMEACARLSQYSLLFHLESIIVINNYWKKFSETPVYAVYDYGR